MNLYKQAKTQSGVYNLVNDDEMISGKFASYGGKVAKYHQSK